MSDLSTEIEKLSINTFLSESLEKQEGEIKENDKLISIQGDCLEKLDLIKDKIIQTICIDPPYNIGKDTWDKIDNYNEFMIDVLKKLETKLKDNGTLMIFHNDMEQIAELMVSIKKERRFKDKST